MCAAFKIRARRHTVFMKNKLLPFAAALAAALAAAVATLGACTIKADSSLKELSDPYIARYECTYMSYGGKDMLDRLDYARVTLENKEELLVEYKLKGGKAHSRRWRYSFDEKTGRLNAEFGAAGFAPKEPIKIEKGKFTISFPIAGKQLVMRFES